MTALSLPEHFTRDSIVRDYRIGVRSREASLLGRREVLTGKAKFGIFGDGKEVAQLALARAFRRGDWRSGYYRDQTFMFALGVLSVEQFFAQLYADADREREPVSGGRQMTAHFSTRLLDERWRLVEPGRGLQLVGRRLADRVPDAPTGGPGAGFVGSIANSGSCPLPSDSPRAATRSPSA